MEVPGSGHRQIREKRKPLTRCGGFPARINSRDEAQTTTLNQRRLSPSLASQPRLSIRLVILRERGGNEPPSDCRLGIADPLLLFCLESGRDGFPPRRGFYSAAIGFRGAPAAGRQRRSDRRAVFLPQVVFRRGQARLPRKPSALLQTLLRGASALRVRPRRGDGKGRRGLPRVAGPVRRCCPTVPWPTW